MKVRIADKRLEHIDSGQEQKAKLSEALVKAVKHKLAIMRAAPDERTLRNWRSLHYEKLQGGGVDERSIRLNDQWRFVFQLVAEDNEPVITDLSIQDYH